MVQTLYNPLSQERSRRTGPLFRPQQWCANEVRGAACKIWVLPMRGGEGRVNNPLLEFKTVDSEGGGGDSLFLFPDHAGLINRRASARSKNRRRTAIRDCDD
ncbi:hypothetical protein TNCV_3881451 [Trichonephila clavipes]|nr:hypothetical protein TNCV_3881451 [Trichonephila clavipes]